jgi:flavorubredoxin/NADPH-dependent 2,4-dienoyl-CoA reductase/sulfur reductase-like enzyme/rubredoxin
MKKLLIKENIWWMGAIDHHLRVFDIIMYTEFGTSYNAYLVKGSKKTALIETVKHTFTEEYLLKLEEEIEIRQIDYLILNHTEPDHAGTVARLVKINPELIVVGAKAAINFVKKISNIPFEFQIVEEGDQLSLGDKNLQFIMAPFLHWPDSIYTYVKEDKLLFTCDSFGSHYAFDEVVYSKVTQQEDYQKALRYYFDMIFGPFKKYVLQAIDKIENLEIEIICTGHGPVLDKNPLEIVNTYKKWAKEERPERQYIVMPYVSAYGYTKEIAERIRDGILSEEGLDVYLYDMVEADQKEVIRKIDSAEGVLFGSPTINGDALLPIMAILIRLSPIVNGGILASSFGSYGWSGEAVKHINRRLEELKMKVIEGYRVNFKPNEAELLEAVNYGRQFAQYVLGKKNVPTVIETKDEVLAFDNTIKKWRCVVCGEIFEGVYPPSICPACGATSEQFEIYEEEAIIYSSDTKEHIVIIGNGAAGISAAEAIIKRNKQATITMIDREPYNAYYKPMLSDYIANDTNIASVFLHDVDWYTDNKIQFKRGREVIRINRENKSLLLRGEGNIQYDKLIISVGSYAFIPPIKNINVKGIVSLRTMTDALKIKELAERSKRTIIIGGGLLGLEVADEIIKMGVEVTVIELSERILPRQLDKKGAAFLEKSIQKTGIQLLTGVSVDEIIGSNQVSGVRLNDGRVLESDLVFVSVGIRADITLGKEASLETNKSIIVDQYMRTNDENIYAAGDVAEYEGINYGIWPEAMEQGRVAGANAVGDKIAYKTITPINIFNGMSMNVLSIGQVIDTEVTGISEMVYEDQDNMIYKRIIFEKDKMIGGILIGDNGKSKLLIDGIKVGANREQMMKVFS